MTCRIGGCQSLRFWLNSCRAVMQEEDQGDTGIAIMCGQEPVLLEIIKN